MGGEYEWRMLDACTEISQWMPLSPTINIHQKKKEEEETPQRRHS
jgi:hypothetical protein